MAVSNVVTKTLAAASTNNIATAQTLGAAGNITLNGSTVTGGVAVLDTARRVLISSVGNDSGITFTVYGYRATTGTASPIQETVTGSAGTSVATNLDFGQVTRVAASGATAANITVGTNGVGSTAWIVVNRDIQPVNIGLQVAITGTISGSIQYTLTDLNFVPGAPVQPAPSPSILPTVFDHSVLNTITANASGAISMPIYAWRWTTNSGTGSVTVTGIQGGIAGP